MDSPAMERSGSFIFAIAVSFFPFLVQKLPFFELLGGLHRSFFFGWECFPSLGS
jgi:hypothetical protein